MSFPLVVGRQAFEVVLPSCDLPFCIVSILQQCMNNPAPVQHAVVERSLHCSPEVSKFWLKLCHENDQKEVQDTDNVIALQIRSTS